MNILQIEQIVKMPTWLIVIALGMVIFLIALALITGREITFWPPKIGARISGKEEVKKKSEGNKIPVIATSEKVNLYTEWRLGKHKALYEEYLDILITNNVITGTRKTVSVKATTEYLLRGYKIENNLRIEYYTNENIGGGQITLQKIVEGWYTGCVSYLNCDTGLFKCYLNRWYDFNAKNQYQENFQQDIL